MTYLTLNNTVNWDNFLLYFKEQHNTDYQLIIMEQQKGDECGDITPVRGKTQREETQHVIKQQKETR